MAHGIGSSDAVETMVAGDGGDLSVIHLLDRLSIVEQRVRSEIARRRAEAEDDGDSRFRGIYISEQRADDLLDQGPAIALEPDELTRRWLLQIEEHAEAVEQAGTTIRLRQLARAFDLAPLDVELLLVALAPDIDRRFEGLYGYLNDDVSLRRATIGLALTMCGASLASGRGRERLGPAAPLRRDGLVEVVDEDRPLLSRSLRVTDRVVSYLLGDPTGDPRIVPFERAVPRSNGPAALELARALTAGATLAYVREGRDTSGAGCAAGALADLGRRALVLDLSHLDPDVDASTLATVAAREARLRGAGLVVGPTDRLAEQDPRTIARFADAGGQVVLYGTSAWDPAWSDRVPTMVEADHLDEPERARLWTEAIGDVLAPDVDPATETAPFRLSPVQIQRAARSARAQATAAGRPVNATDLQRGARSQNAAGLQRLARRIEPRADWDELILPGPIEGQLRELAARWRHRDLVLEEWGLSQASRGKGVSALFAGGSGTGKTLASEVIANELGLDLYLIDLSTVVDKYIGETSKNLDRIFDQADQVNGVLLFDEADALFGKRSAVSDAKDRHANVEVAFLLQRMEAFDGVVILTTNLAANLDEAFMRRLDAVVDFPTPDEHQRRALWSAKLGEVLPQAPGIDVAILAERFRLSGSEIHNVVVSAAYRAADSGQPVTMTDLIRAAIREHRKIGRHLSPSDLGEYAVLLENDGGGPA